jgi:hypothetical protein
MDSMQHNNSYFQFTKILSNFHNHYEKIVSIAAKKCLIKLDYN